MYLLPTYPVWEERGGAVVVQGVGLLWFGGSDHWLYWSKYIAKVVLLDNNPKVGLYAADE